MNKRIIKGIVILAILAIVAILLVTFKDSLVIETNSNTRLVRFSSDRELINLFKEQQNTGYRAFGGMLEKSVMMDTAVASQAANESLSSDDGGSDDFSETNVQVEGVDEADIIKTDGQYIYAVSNNTLIIVKAYPKDEAEIISETKLDNFYANEIFITEDKLLLFGNQNYQFEYEPIYKDDKDIGDLIEIEQDRDVPNNAEMNDDVVASKVMVDPGYDYYPHYRYYNMTAVKLFDITNKEEPDLLRTVEFQGNYITSRKIGDYAYFVINSYPNFYYALEDIDNCSDIVPLYRDSNDKSFDENTSEDDFTSISCKDIGYIRGIEARNFITIASISLEDETKDIKKETILGSGQNVYSSLENMYVVQTQYPRYSGIGELVGPSTNQTVITKFNLDKGKIEFKETSKVNGTILNQFSMDEYDNHFRIATTSREHTGTRSPSVPKNNVYVLDEDLKVVGSLEDLAPGESIYSVRFMDKKGYVVTYKNVDPLFVIDLEDHTNPNVLGKLKIPGYSDYLHPYDETHIIGIGKDSIEDTKNKDFAWYQGVKMAIFDVSDVENPIELHKEIIGDRGTQSYALHDHKAFLFDKEKNLLVLPITLAEIKGEKTQDNQYGDYTYQGAYVYNIDLENGFDLKGRITHYDDPEIFEKSGYYFYGDRNIKRSLYIEDVLYTFSDFRLQLNNLDTLELIKKLDFSNTKSDYPHIEPYLE